MYEKAKWALEHAERLQPLRSGVLLRLWRYPSFDAWRSWTVFPGEPGWVTVREVLWDQPHQRSRLYHPLLGLQEWGKPLPLFRVHESTLSMAVLEPWIARYQALFPLPPVPEGVMLDGQRNGAVVIVDGQEWIANWESGWREWEARDAWADELQAVFMPMSSTHIRER